MLPIISGIASIIYWAPLYLTSLPTNSTILCTILFKPFTNSFDFKSREMRLNEAEKVSTGNHFISFSINNTLIVDEITKTKLNDISKRLISSFKVFYRNSSIKNFSLFVQAYQGQDYYNIQFVNNISFVRLGVCCEPSRILTLRKNRKNPSNII